MQIDLSDKVVLVTGASRGIGRAIAAQAGHAGATVAVHYLQHESSAREVADGLARARTFKADLADVDACTGLVREVIGAFGRIDVLVNNAGVAIPVELEAPFDAWRNAWETTLAVNLTAPEVLTREVLKHFLAQAGEPGRLRVVNVASRAAFRGDTPAYTAYAASKGGLVALTRTIARGYGKQGVRAFTVAPGFTETQMAQDFIDRYGEQVVGDLALERLTQPDDVAPTVIFLASGLADHATGCTVDVNAGSYVH